MDKLKARINELAALMDEFRLSEAEIDDGATRVAFRRRPAPTPKMDSNGETHEHEHHFHEGLLLPVVEEKPLGIPVSSPMTGIYYSSPSPNAPAFVKEGEPVTAGQVVGLIEAMKVFNEITAPNSGLVTKLLATNGQLVQPGDPLLYIG